jgi:predicted ATP-binding protein involved in virulence
MGKASLSEQRTDDTTASLFSDDVDLINAEEWLLQADYAASKSPNSTRAGERRDQVIEILKALLPDVDDVRFRASEEAISAPTVEFHTPYGWVRLQDLSLGYRTLLTWMVDLASRLFDRYPHSENPLAEPAVVLVDEIDLHLHPRWQRTLLGFLSERFPNTQFIATAHSPLVVQAAGDANIVLLRRNGDQVVIDNDVERIHNWRVDQILTSELFGLDTARPPQVSPALEERKKILSKPRLTKADEKRLADLEAQIGNLPTGETPEDLQAMDIIRRAAALLKTG